MFVKELVNINSCNEVNIKVIVAMKYSSVLQDKTTYLEKQPPTISNETYIFMPLKQSWNNNITIAFRFLVLKYICPITYFFDLKKGLQKQSSNNWCYLQIAINLDAEIQLIQWMWFGPLLVSTQRLSSGCVESLWSQSILALQKIKLLLISLFNQVYLYSIWYKIVWRNTLLIHDPRRRNSGSF